MHRITLAVAAFVAVMFLALVPDRAAAQLNPCGGLGQPPCPPGTGNPIQLCSNVPGPFTINGVPVVTAIQPGSALPIPCAYGGTVATFTGPKYPVGTAISIVSIGGGAAAFACHPGTFCTPTGPASVNVVVGSGFFPELFGGINFVTATITGAPVPPFASSLPSMGTCLGQAVTITAQPGVTTTGTGGRDVIQGTEGPDVINALAGDDIICGNGGDDTIDGGFGDDTIDGGLGNDALQGGGGSDRIEGRGGNDTIDGGGGDDPGLSGGDGDDSVSGGGGNDVIYGDGGTNSLFGNGGNDTLNGAAGSLNTFDGGAGTDTCNGVLTAIGAVVSCEVQNP